MATARRRRARDRARAFALLEDSVTRHLVEPNMVLGPELDPLRADLWFGRSSAR